MNEELADLGLTTMEKRQAIGKIVFELESMYVFFSFTDAKKEWVSSSLRRHLDSAT